MQKVLSEAKGDRTATAAPLTKIYQNASIPALTAVRGALHEMSEVIETDVSKAEQHLHAVEQSTKRNIIILTVVSLVAGAGVSFFYIAGLVGSDQRSCGFCR